MSFQVETDAIPIPAESDDTANAISTKTNSESLNIADTPPQDQVTNDQNNDDFSNQTIQEPLTDLVLPLRPPKDFEMNNFLLCLAEEIEHDDLEKMKFLLLGEEGISTRTTEQIKSPLDLFKLLKKRSIISRHDILYLQLMLKFTGKEKSIRKACDFANNTKETIHFFPPPEKPADGYKYAQLHVKVPDAQKYTRQSLENLRRRISMMTFALESDIHIVRWS
ncbi:uncharacterized protein LOC128556271 [Mercenaria mercenaria]|uniref:uncharacterized protein LOC128556271 n=1 Tax=Mercenaria mercenaria TaxID=6596 RepID=UPI00234EAF1B|nr:uncharacterized protein LOC128556271 [Mercenaria mercenaria]